MCREHGGRRTALVRHSATAGLTAQASGTQAREVSVIRSWSRAQSWPQAQVLGPGGGGVAALGRDPLVLLLFLSLASAVAEGARVQAAVGEEAERTRRGIWSWRLRCPEEFPFLKPPHSFCGYTWPGGPSRAPRRQGGRPGTEAQPEASRTRWVPATRAPAANLAPSPGPRPLWEGPTSPALPTCSQNRARRRAEGSWLAACL